MAQGAQALRARGIPLEEARQAAGHLLESLADYCERVELAGSVRRERRMVKDIEVVPTPEERDFFEAIGWHDYPAPHARRMVAIGVPK